jgi:hypothetical protein
MLPGRVRTSWLSTWPDRELVLFVALLCAVLFWAELTGNRKAASDLILFTHFLVSVRFLVGMFRGTWKK